MNLLRSLKDNSNFPPKSSVQFATKLATRLFGDYVNEVENIEQDLSQLENMNIMIS